MASSVFHIIPYEKFTFDYIESIDRCFNPEDHHFYVHGNKPNNNIKSCDLEFINVHLDTNPMKNIGLILKLSKKCNKIIVHSLIVPRYILITIAFISLFYKQKLFWNIWGVDLYNDYWSRNKTIKHRIDEIFRRYIIRNLKAVGYIKSDDRFLKKNYKNYSKFYLASYNYHFIELQKTQNNNSTCILIGNSATETCRHIEALEMIKKASFDNPKIICILAYPKSNIEYIDSVIKRGKELFGDNFSPMVDFMPYDKYMELLSDVDIAIFNNNRQQALGNIAELLFYGKTVYVSEDNGCYEYFKDMSANLFSMSELLSKKYLSTDEIKKNKETILNFFSDENFKKRWEVIFEDNY